MSAVLARWSFSKGNAQLSPGQLRKAAVHSKGVRSLERSGIPSPYPSRASRGLVSIREIWPVWPTIASSEPID